MGLGDLRAGIPRGRCAAPTRTGQGIEANIICGIAISRKSKVLV